MHSKSAYFHKNDHKSQSTSDHASAEPPSSFAEYTRDIPTTKPATEPTIEDLSVALVILSKEVKVLNKEVKDLRKRVDNPDSINDQNEERDTVHRLERIDRPKALNNCLLVFTLALFTYVLGKYLFELLTPWFWGHKQDDNEEIIDNIVQTLKRIRSQIGLGEE